MSDNADQHDYVRALEVEVEQLRLRLREVPGQLVHGCGAKFKLAALGWRIQFHCSWALRSWSTT